MAAEGRAMMGSKADMIGSKFDEVARNQIWREHLRKEARDPVKAAEFVINPKTMKPISGKPGTMVPRPDKEDGDEEFQTLKASLHKKEEAPLDKYDFPATASQEIGWYHANAKREKYNHFSTKCEETKYAESYYAMAGTSPYARMG